jgi:hypothetical protein
LAKQALTSKRVFSAKSVIAGVTWTVTLVGVAAGIGVAVSLYRSAVLPETWLAQAAVFVALACLPQFVIDRVAQLTESVAQDDLPGRVITRGFENLGAWVGVIERPLLLGALVGRFPEFIAGWYVLKGIAGYSLGMNKKDVQERRAFQLFLINNGMSFAFVALAWLIWSLLKYPTLAIVGRS